MDEMYSGLETDFDNALFLNYVVKEDYDLLAIDMLLEEIFRKTIVN